MRYCTLIFILCTLYSKYSLSDTNPCPESILIANNYLVGFVTDGDSGIEHARVIVTDQTGVLTSLRTGDNGWFESATAIFDDIGNSYLTLTILASGHSYCQTRLVLDGSIGPPQDKSPNDHITLKLIPLDEPLVEEGTDSKHTKYMYGRIVNDVGSPIPGALITINYLDGKAVEHLLASAVSRSSGYYSLVYPSGHESDKPKLTYTIRHREHNSSSNTFKLHRAPELGNYVLSQKKARYSLGLAIQGQFTGTIDDKESGGAALLNFSLYSENVIVADNQLPNRDSFDTLAYDFSIGLIPYQETQVGNDTVDNIIVFGVGVSFMSRLLPFPVRTGLSYSETHEAAAYIGVNLPFYFW